jgi:hypothetical protein
MRLQKISSQSTGGLRFEPLTRVKVDYSIRAYSDSNPGLQVSTFSRDARTPEATKAYRNFELVTISNSFARTSGTYEEDALHKALRFEPVTFISQTFGSASKGDSIQKLQRLTWVFLPRFKPSIQAQVDSLIWHTLNRTQDFEFRPSVETRGPPRPPGPTETASSSFARTSGT